MTVYQCPIGHPPGPQEFCPICGRRAEPVETAAATPPPPPPPPAAPPPSAPGSGGSWESVRSEVSGDAPGAGDQAPMRAFDLDAPVEGSPPPPLAPPGPPAGATSPSAPPGPAPAPPTPPSGGPSVPPPPPPSPPAPPAPFVPAPPLGESPFGAGTPAGPGSSADDDAPGGAAAKARELIAELSGQQAPPSGPTIPAQPPGGPLPPAPPDAPAAPYLPPGSPVPSFGDRGPGPDQPAPIPSYAPTEPPGLGFPTPLPADLPAFDDEPASPGQWSDGTTPPPPSRTRPSHGEDDGVATGRGESPPRRLPVLLLLLVVLLGAGYLVWSQLLGGDDETLTTTPPVRASASASPAPAAPTPARTLSAAELASSLTNAHFKHGYDWAKQNGPVAAAEREQVCRTEAFKERDAGYPWGAQDRAGCLIGLAG